MALTLLEAAKREQESGNVFRAAIIEVYANSNDLLRNLPFDDIPGNAYRYDQESMLPGVSFRGVNEGYDESTGVINPLVEPLVIAGGDLDVDKFITDTMGTSHRSRHEAMKLKALAHTWAHKFWKGDSSNDPREFDGLQRRLTGSQLIPAGNTSGGDALSLAKLDELLDAVDNPTGLWMNKTMKRRLKQAARDESVAGRIEFSRDEFGRGVTTYDGVPIYVVGDNGSIFDTLSFTEENPGGGSAVGTSIYCTSFGDGFLKGIQNGSPDARDLGELESKPVFRTRVEWYCGLVLEHPRAAARLYGIKDAAVVS